jgi:hypothetical protein
MREEGLIATEQELDLEIAPAAANVRNVPNGYAIDQMVPSSNVSSIAMSTPQLVTPMEQDVPIEESPS